MKSKEPETLYIISPCYNEEETIPLSIPVFISKLNDLIMAGRVSGNSRVLLVDDGSCDSTWEIMECMRGDFPDRLETLHLAGNSGEIMALLTGMREACEKADIVVTIDCDLQDDIDAIDRMLDLHDSGACIVHGCRPSRKTDSKMYRFCANSFYFLMRVFGSKIVPHSSEYRLMTKAAVKELLASERKNLFLPAEIPLLHFPSANVFYERKSRIAGKSNYNYIKLLKLATGAFINYTVFFEIVTVGAVICVAFAAKEMKSKTR